MEQVMMHTRESALWHALVGEAQAFAGIMLEQQSEGYLVNTLMRMLGSTAGKEPDLNFLDDFSEKGNLQHLSLQEIADQCLIYAGLFPDYAEEKNVSINYFVEMGQAAYAELSTRKNDQTYAEVSQNFVKIMDVLQCMREIDDGYACLQPLQAYDLWDSTGSSNAYKALQHNSSAMPVATTSTFYH